MMIRLLIVIKTLHNIVNNQIDESSSNSQQENSLTSSNKNQLNSSSVTPSQSNQVAQSNNQIESKQSSDKKVSTIVIMIIMQLK